MFRTNFFGDSTKSVLLSITNNIEIIAMFLKSFMILSIFIEKFFHLWHALRDLMQKQGTQNLMRQKVTEMKVSEKKSEKKF